MKLTIKKINLSEMENQDHLFLQIFKEKNSQKRQSKFKSKK